MSTLKCTSDFIRKLYQHQSSQSLSLEIPNEIVPYTNFLIRLHNTPRQVLTQTELWINDWTYVLKNVCHHVHLYYYDESNPDLMIEIIDDAEHRKSWAICFEAYLRRLLILLYNRNEDIVLKNVLLPLPAVNPYTNNPDDIRMQEVKIKSFPFDDCCHGSQCIPPEYRHFKWYIKNRNPNEQPPKFRCRPALLNSMDCMTLLHDNMTFPSKELMIKVAYYLRPFRFFLSLTFLYDIYGGFKNTPPIEYSLPDHSIKNRFPDDTVLIDRVERAFLEEFQKSRKSAFSEDEVVLPRVQTLSLQAVA